MNAEYLDLLNQVLRRRRKEPVPENLKKRIWELVRSDRRCAEHFSSLAVTVALLVPPEPDPELDRMCREIERWIDERIKEQ